MVFLKFLSCFTISTDKVSDCGTNDVVRVDSCNKKKNKFSWDAIMKKSMKVIGSGGFSTVYLADQLPGEKNLTAVKIQWACTDRLAQIHDQELQILSRINHHPNIIKFVGHFKSGSDEKCGLLFEYASNGTLHDKLHTLTWKQRTLIAYQLASALEYLHSMQIIHGDIKASNILLDENLNCKLCDFGSATLGGGFTSMVLPPLPSTLNRRRIIIMGSQGYVDPYYLKTGLVSTKNDIYSYGVVLLELITGREAFSLIDEKKKIIGKMMSEVVVDPHCDGLDAEEVKAMVSIAGLCLGPSPMVRPCANELVASLSNFKTIRSRCDRIGLLQSSHV